MPKYSRGLIGQRTRDALRAARERGTVLGRPRVLPDDIVDRIASAHAGGLSLRAIARQLNEDSVRTADAKQLSLSDRDRQVVAALLAGRSNDEIGMDLGISRKTVEARISRLFERFGVTSRVDLARRADREQWLELAVTAPSRDEPA